MITIKKIDWISQLEPKARYKKSQVDYTISKAFKIGNVSIAHGGIIIGSDVYIREREIPVMIY